MLKPEFYVIKGLFSGDKSTGACFLKLDREQKVFSDVVVGIRGGNVFKALDPDQPYMRFRELLIQAIAGMNEGEPFFEESKKTERFFLSEIDKERIEKIINLIESPGDEYLKNILVRDIITEDVSKFYSEIEGKINIMIESIYPDIEEESKEEKADIKEESKEEKTEESTTISTKPVVDPISGKKIKKLKIGDNIILKLVNINDLKNFGNKLDFYEKSDSITKAKIIGEVIEVKKSGPDEPERIKLMCKVGKNLFSFLSLQPDLKISYMGEENENGNDKDEGYKKIDINILFIVGGIALMLLVIFILIFIF